MHVKYIIYIIYIADIPMVTWIVDNFPEMGRIKDSSGDLPIHFASAGGNIIRFFLCMSLSIPENFVLRLFGDSETFG